MSDSSLDDRDRAILHHSQEDGRRPVTGIAADLASSIDELGLTIEHEHLIRDHVHQPYSGFDPPDYLARK